MSRFGNHATLDQEQWQLLVDVLDGNYDERKLDDAQDALTQAAPLAWIEEAEAADDARRAAAEQSEVGEAGGEGVDLGLHGRVVAGGAAEPSGCR